MLQEKLRQKTLIRLSKNKINLFRGKVMLKILSDVMNNHRLSRKPMTQEDRAEFIKKSKEFSAFKVFILISKEK